METEGEGGGESEHEQEGGRGAGENNQFYLFLCQMYFTSTLRYFPSLSYLSVKWENNRP